VGLFAYGATQAWDNVRLVEVLGGALLCAFVGNLDRFESFKATPAGIEAKTRAIVAQAEGALAEVRRLATTVGTVLVGLVASEGRFGGGMTAPQKDALKAEVLATLKAVGVSPTEIASVAKVDHPYVLIDYCTGITTEFSMPGRDRLPAWNAYWSKWWEGMERPPADDLRAFLSSLATIEPWREELLKDYEHFRRTGEHRRPAIWERREEWPVWSKEGTWPTR
jgi:hypothetical protein